MVDLEEEIERREAEKMIDVHRTAIEKIDDQIQKLERQRSTREGLLQKAELRAKGIKPCLVCNRHVPSPCNSPGGMAEHGPWDQFCKEFMNQ